MKILLAGQAFYRKDNGQATFTVSLAEGLARSGHQVAVLAPKVFGPGTIRKNGLDVHRVTALNLGHNANVSAFSGRRIEKVLETLQPDLVHIQDHYFISRSVWRKARRRNIPVVGTNHFLPDNLTDNVHLAGFLRPMVQRLLWRNMLGLFNRLDGVAAPTPTAALILEQAGCRVPVEAISNGVDIQHFQPRPAADRRHLRWRYGIDPSRSVFLYVGRVDREKGLDVLLKAAIHLADQPLQIVICGKGRFLSALKHMRKDLGLKKRVILTGYVPDDDLPLLYNSADVFVMPGAAELQSIATLEAMASGRPVLAADACALPELVRPGVNGLLFQPGSSTGAERCIRDMLSLAPNWPAMGRASRRRAEQHALGETLRRYTTWYEKIIRQHRAKGKSDAARSGLRDGACGIPKF